MNINDLINRPKIAEYTPKQTKQITQKVIQSVKLESVKPIISSVDQLQDVKEFLVQSEQEIIATLQHIKKNADPAAQPYFDLVDQHKWDPFSLTIDSKSRPTYPPQQVTTAMQLELLEFSEDRRAPYYQELSYALEFNQILQTVAENIYSGIDLKDNQLTKFALQQIFLQGLDNLNFTNLIYNLQNKILDDYKELGEQILDQFIVNGKIEDQDLVGIKTYTNNLLNGTKLAKDLKSISWTRTMSKLKSIRGSMFDLQYQITLDNLAINTLARAYEDIIGELDSDVQQSLGALFNIQTLQHLENQTFNLFKRAEEGLVRQFSNQTIQKDLRDLSYLEMIELLDNHSMNRSLDTGIIEL